MSRDRDFTAIGRALAAPARSTFLNLLMDGSTRPAGDLARTAGVSASTASQHLGVLLDAGLVRVVERGRNRFFELAGPEIATALEGLGTVAPSAGVNGYRQHHQAQRLSAARFCYDHLAGRLATDLADAWVEQGWLADRDQLALTERGTAGLTRLGVDVASATTLRRPTTRSCPDWTERRPHLAGALGAAVAEHFITAGWLRRHRSGRGLDLTPIGYGVLRERWPLHWPAGGAGDPAGPSGGGPRGGTRAR